LSSNFLASSKLPAVSESRSRSEQEQREKLEGLGGTDQEGIAADTDATQQKQDLATAATMAGVDG